MQNQVERECGTRFNTVGYSLLKGHHKKERIDQKKNKVDEPLSPQEMLKKDSTLGRSSMMLTLVNCCGTCTRLIWLCLAEHVRRRLGAPVVVATTCEMISNKPSVHEQLSDGSCGQ